MRAGIPNFCSLKENTTSQRGNILLFHFFLPFLSSENDFEFCDKLKACACVEKVLHQFKPHKRFQNPLGLVGKTSSQRQT